MTPNLTALWIWSIRSPLQMTGGWPFSLVFDDPQLEKAANTGLYKISSDSSSLTAPADVTFTWSDGHLEVIKKFHFDHSYVVTVETTTNYNGSHVLAGLAWRGGFGDVTVTDPAPVDDDDDVLQRKRKALHLSGEEAR